MDSPPIDACARIRDLFPGAVAAAVATAASFEAPLLRGEETTVRTAVASRRREFAAGRDCARRALAQLGGPQGPIPGRDRAPVWPSGFVGSISHCKGFCAAVAGRQADFASIGFDVENLSALSAAAARIILTPAETTTLTTAPPAPGLPWVTIAFSAKEAVYKSVHPLTRERLSFHDVALAFRPDGRFSVEAAASDLSSAHLFPAIEGRWDVDADRVYTGACLRAAAIHRSA
jgi:4'-phosphopantetheinyl transferase EntD